MPLYHDAIEKNAAKHPEKCAIALDAIHYSYGMLQTRMTHIARLLVANGVQPGDRVALYSPICIDLIAAYLAVLRAGAITAATHPTYSREKLVYQLKHTGAKVLITQGVDALETLCRETDLDRIILIGNDETSHPQIISLDRAVSVLDAQAAALPDLQDDTRATSIFYTSGSTFNPKGVVVNHRIMGAATTAIAAYLNNTADDVILSYSTLASDYGVYNILMPLYFGGTSVIESRPPTAANDVLEVIKRERVTGMHVFPPIFFLLAETQEHWQRQLPTLRYISSSGQPLYSRHIERIRTALPDVQIFSNYGLTECKRVSYLPPEEIDRRPTSVGKPLPGVSVFIVDDNGERIIQPNIIGELWVTCDYLMLEYWKMPEATNVAIKTQAFGEARLYRTGDLFKMDDQGFLYYIARKDDVFARNIWNVNPREIEQCLASHPAVAQVVVVSVADESAGFLPKACVVLERDHDPSCEAALQEHCKRLMDWHMVPAQWAFMDALPQTDSGKTTGKGLV
ncbi:class I adenylate-forming enzyme family protein [Pseudomonas mucidolens]|uniref:class I adenylate-forming enzyme family protein n=1 Tax=Pseudomonas mucidolens TaxID=46679 RepID=UPI0030DA9896